MTDSEYGALSALTLKMDTLTQKVDTLSKDLATLNGRFQGGWWVVMVLGGVASAIIGWLATTHTHVRLD